MKNIVSLSLVATIAASSSMVAFGAMNMEGSMMMDNSSMMMKNDAMMMNSSTSMNSNSMMKSTKLSSMNVTAVAMHFGYKWRTDRMKLAKMVGISNYRGTYSQNMMIKAYLIKNNGMAMAGVMVGGAMMLPSRDIVDNAVLASNVTTVVAAVKAAGLVDTLKSAGPFTVFAPNNSAFEKLPAGTVNTLLMVENKGMLTDILTYHVVAGKYKSSDLTDGLMLTTVEGKTLKFTRVNGKLMINGSAMVETADVISTNGVTHVIDTVLMPPEGVMVGGALMVKNKDIVDNAMNASNVTTVVAAVQAAGLVDTLKSAGPFTVFAPTNSAFEKLPAGTVTTLLKAENKGTLVDILTYHVVAGKYTSADLTDGLTLTTVEGKTLRFTRVNGKLMINGSAMVETADVISTNGVTHVIDTVLMPSM